LGFFKVSNLSRLIVIGKKIINIRQRVIDPAILLCDWDEDESLPNMKKCKERLNLEGEVSHTALADAWDVVQMLRKFY
jgi:hypothetical protein